MAGDGYAGATDTTRRLLNYWFLAAHRRHGGRRLEYHYAQRRRRDAHLALRGRQGPPPERPHRELCGPQGLEVARVRRLPALLREMATGSGKTKVMSLAVAWQYLNATAESRDDFAKILLVDRAQRPSFSSGCEPISKAVKSSCQTPVIPDELRSLLGLSMLHASRKRTGQFAQSSCP